MSAGPTVPAQRLRPQPECISVAPYCNAQSCSEYLAQLLYNICCTQVDPDITEQEEKKHGRSERAQLQAEVQPDSHRSDMSAGWLSFCMHVALHWSCNELQTCSP